MKWKSMTLGLVVGAACARPGVQSAAPPELPATPPDAAELDFELEAAVRDLYRALSAGFDEAYLDGMARDQRLVLIDLGPEDVVVGFDAGHCLSRRPFHEEGLVVIPKALQVRVSADGTVGWSHEDLSLRVGHEGLRTIIPVRATEIFERRAGRWLLVQRHASYAVPDGVSISNVELGLLGSYTSPGLAAGEVRALLEHLVRDPEKATGSFTQHAVLIRHAPDFAGMVLKDLRVRTGATGAVAWAAARLEGRLQDRDGGETRVPLRATWVVVRDGDGAWRVAQEHISVPVGRTALWTYVLGEPP